MHVAKNRTAEEAVGRWPGILQSLGIDPAYLVNKHGPCPICAGKDRYRFDDRQGRGTWICSHCGAGDGFRLLQELQGLSFGEAAREVDRIVGTVPAGPVAEQRTDESKLAALRAVWVASKPVMRGDPVWQYLNRRTGLVDAPADLRYHPALRYTTDGVELGRFPAMLALMRYPDGQPASLHRTYLTAHGQKANVPQCKKIMSGKPLKSSAVRLAAASDYLGIAEGIESALGAAKRFGVPVWAATNAILLESWVPPAGVERVLIAADNDADSSWTGQAAAYNLARRLVRAGYTVDVQVPINAGEDWCHG